MDREVLVAEVVRRVDGGYSLEGDGLRRGEGFWKGRRNGRIELS